MTPFLPIILTALGVSLLMTPWFCKLAYTFGAVDRPSGRKVHEKETPCLGGPAIFISFLLVVMIFVPLRPDFYGLLLGGLIILLIGVYDDIKGFTPKQKLMGQILAALVFIAFGNQVDFLSSPYDGLLVLGIFSVPVTIFWVVGVTNALNLIDGLDGLASGVSAIALSTFFIIALFNQQIVFAMVVLALLGGVLGFLRYNFYPAKIFLGDSGSLFLGFMVAGLSVMGLMKGVTFLTLGVPIMILGVPILDTCFAIVRRFRFKKPIFQADKEHLHHWLLKMGLSHKQAVLVIYLLSFGCSLSAFYLILNGM